MDLADYERRKFDFAEILRGAAALLPERNVGGADPTQELFARLAEDRFNLVVVGRFSRGKSSLMNAILGMDRLPTGIVPLTSVITTVSYGSEECVVVTYEGSLLRSEVKLEQLAEYVTQEGNPGNVRRVELAEIQLPAEILRRGFYFIDTPGLGSATPENTRTTEAFLPNADAFLLVTGYEGPLSEDEFRFLRQARASARRIFVAVNKQDCVGPSERDQALTYVRNQLEALFGPNRPEVFSTSATEGLQAKQARDESRLVGSGVRDLEQAILNFLVTEKSQEFLLRMCDRVERLLGTLPPSSQRQELAVRVRDLRAQLAPVADGSAAPAAIGGLAPVHPESAEACEVCRAIEEASFEFLRCYQYDITVSEIEQGRLAEIGGLCSLHTWWYYNLASPQGICVGYPRLLERWVDELARLAAEPRSCSADAALTIENDLPTQASCPVCSVCRAAESEALGSAAMRLGDTNGGAIDELSAICLRHLAALLRLIECQDFARELLRRQAGLFERIAEDMRRYALKRDALRRGLASRAEDRSAIRALRLLAGQPNVSFARRAE